MSPIILIWKISISSSACTFAPSSSTVDRSCYGYYFFVAILILPTVEKFGITRFASEFLCCWSVCLLCPWEKTGCKMQLVLKRHKLICNRSSYKSLAILCIFQTWVYTFVSSPCGNRWFNLECRLSFELYSYVVKLASNGL